MNDTITIDDLNWSEIKNNVHETLDGEIRPATWEEMADAIEAAHPDDDLPMGVVETATSAGFLNRKGEGLEDAYTFNLDAFEEEDEQTEEDNHITDDGREFAPAMVDRDSWLIYEVGDKAVKAPWKTGHLYNASWGMQLEPNEYPETDFAKANRWADKSEEMGLEGAEEVDGLGVGYLLQREVLPPEENITMIDIDDCRDPEEEYIIPEAQDIIDRADSYTEISQSGEGVHIFVFGHLPEWLASSRVVEPMHTDERPAGEQPKVEMYHRRRIAITTGKRLEGTPDDVQYGHDLIEELTEEYYNDDRTAEDVMDDMADEEEDDDWDDSTSSSDKKSPYFAVQPASLVNSNKYRKIGSRVQGPHPEHGSSGGSSYADGGRNFNADGGKWTCYRCGSGGNALHLVAVMEGYIDCDESGQGCLSSLSDVEYAKLCLDARDSHGFSGKPPYRALLGLAKAQKLASESDETIDYALKDVVLEMYENASASML